MYRSDIFSHNVYIMWNFNSISKEKGLDITIQFIFFCLLYNNNYNKFILPIHKINFQTTKILSYILLVKQRHITTMTYCNYIVKQRHFTIIYQQISQFNTCRLISGHLISRQRLRTLARAFMIPIFADKLIIPSGITLFIIPFDIN